MPARNPPTTGYGTNRTRLPSLNFPSAKKTTPQRTVTTRVAAITVRKTSGGSKASPVVVSAASSATLAAVVAATTPSTATAASCTLPTTPREPALQARIPSVRTAATRYRPMPSPRRPTSTPPNTKAANAIASTASTAPMISPAASEGSQPCDRRTSDTIPPF